MTGTKWDKEVLQNMINNQIQENLNLDYKRAAAIDKDKTTDITKDVSSFANSDGGVIIYGIKEFDEKNKKHFPEKINAININEYNKEWLDQIINLIRPKIEGIKIEPVMINDEEVVYVVEIPKGNVAHQALDKRYYRRRNFISEPMEDYEIRDINNRTVHPNITLDLDSKTLIWESSNNLMPSYTFNEPRKINRSTDLRVYAKNIGHVIAQYVNIKLYIPSDMLVDKDDKDNDSVSKFRLKNRFRDVAEYKSTGMGGAFPKAYNPYRFEPILPDDYLFIKEISIIEDLEKFQDMYIEWTINADNAPVRTGRFPIKDIVNEIEDRRKDK
jgi:hypothetical protein